MHLHGSQAHCLSVAHKTFTLHPRRAMSYTLQNLTPRTGTPSSPFPASVFLQSEQPCEDQRPQQSGALTETPPLTRSLNPHPNQSPRTPVSETPHPDLEPWTSLLHRSATLTTHPGCRSWVPSSIPCVQPDHTPGGLSPDTPITPDDLTPTVLLEAPIFTRTLAEGCVSGLTRISQKTRFFFCLGPLFITLERLASKCISVVAYSGCCVQRGNTAG